MSARKIEFHSLKEDPDLWEQLIENENRCSATDEASKSVVESMYWETDRAHAFQRYVDSLDFRQIDDLLQVFRISRKHPLCEIGGGSGQLAWSLVKSGFQQVELLEPNPRWITGTAWLETQLAELGGTLTICNSLDAWYGDEKVYHTIVTRNCVHHFPNIPMIAAAIRQKVKKGGYWVMIREWYADTPAELRRQMVNHPYCQKYGVYEFPFPARHYIGSLEYAGFKLRSVVPAGWGNNALSSYTDSLGSTWNQTMSKAWRWVFKKMPKLTVLLYRLEDGCNRVLGTKFRAFSRPQMIVFQRVED
jgi:2-polyprenyl-3-methyl-5-hydroxy-6-metoxy-1,4-benzoquinol methylase